MRSNEDRYADRAEGAGPCPHVDRNDITCATRFSLSRLDQAFTICFGAYRGCPMFQRLERAERQVEVLAPVALTILGHGLRRPVHATGT